MKIYYSRELIARAWAALQACNGDMGACLAEYPDIPLGAIYRAVESPYLRGGARS